MDPVVGVSLLPALLALLGTLIGALAGIGSTLGLELLRSRRERRSTATAFAAEAAEAVARALASGAPFTRPISRRPLTTTLIYEKNADRLGLLSPHLASRVVTFFTAWQAVLFKWESLQPALSARDNMEAAQTLKEIAQLYRTVATLGDGLPEALESFGGSNRKQS